MSEEKLPYNILAFYYFGTIKNPQEEIEKHKKFLSTRDVTARIYISEQGINGQMCAANEDAKEYIEWIHSQEAYADIHFQIDPYHEHAFPRLSIKYRKQLVAIDKEVDLEKKGEHLSPKEWREKLEGEEEKILVDVRNDYEWKVGHFEGAELPPHSSFREFDAYADELKVRKGCKTPIMMYCTGGIRCEIYSALLKEKGFETIYQLQGGVINYGHKEGSKHWLGKLFVFDDRLTAPISKERTKVIGKCHHCNTSNESYYNCANTNCNTLFLCCPECLKKFSGCCQKTCQESPRCRPYEQQNPHKPFRRWHHYFSEKNTLNASPSD